MARSVIPLLITFALVSSAVQSVAIAEPSAAQRREAQFRVDEVRALLALTPEQDAKIAPLIQARNDKIQALRASIGSDPTRRERRALAKETRNIQQELLDKVEPILTEEQKKQWDVIRKEMRAAAKDRE